MEYGSYRKHLKVKLFIAMITVVTLLNNAGAQNLQDAPNGVKVQKVSFPNRIQINVVGNLFLPPNLDLNRKYPAIVVGHTFTGVKEQTSGLHAQKLAELGYITLAFDASFWGESGGSPRNIRVPDLKNPYTYKTGK